MLRRRLDIKLLIKFILVVSVLICIDQGSKIYVLSMFLVNSTPMNIFPFFDIMFVLNQGVSFGILQGWPYQIIIVLSFISLLTIVLVILYSFKLNKTVKFWVLSLILSGALGNFIDRWLYAGVIDFIYLHYLQFYFPIFNLADCMISIGVMILLLYLFINRKVSQGKNVET